MLLTILADLPVGVKYAPLLPFKAKNCITWGLGLSHSHSLAEEQRSTERGRTTNVQRASTAWADIDFLALTCSSIRGCIFPVPLHDTIKVLVAVILFVLLCCPAFGSMTSFSLRRRYFTVPSLYHSFFFVPTESPIYAVTTFVFFFFPACQIQRWLLLLHNFTAKTRPPHTRTRFDGPRQHHRPLFSALVRALGT